MRQRMSYAEKAFLRWCIAHASQGHSQKELADLWKVSQPQVSIALREYGMRRRKPWVETPAHKANAEKNLINRFPNA